MGFLKRNWEKITANTLSGLMVRVIAALIFLAVGVVWVIPKIGSQPVDVDNDIAKELLAIARQILSYLYFITILLLPWLPTLLEGLDSKRKDKHKELELKNENLKLENENLKLQLELKKQEQQPPRDKKD